MRSRIVQFAGLVVFGLVGCGSPEADSVMNAAGATPTGGGSAGGDSATGGVSAGGVQPMSGGAGTGGVQPTGGADTGGVQTMGGTGGVPPTGGGGGVSTGGVQPMGGGGTGGVGPTGGLGPTGGVVQQTGGAGTGGLSPTGGSGGTGGFATGGQGTGGQGTGGQGTGGQGTGGQGTGGQGTGGSTDITGPCDIYAAANTPCVGAYSMVRVLSSTYSGPLYQVRAGAPNADRNTGSGGTPHDIGMTADGFADAAAQDAVCNGTTCTVSILYDQSGRGNDLRVAPAGCYEGTASENDYETSATDGRVTVGGHSVYSLYMEKHEGYRNNNTQGIPTGSQDSGIYMVAAGSGLRPGAGCCCCWNFGTASTDNCYGPTGMMAALYLGTGYWGSGAGQGPWFMGDFEAGVWAGGSGDSGANNPNSPSMTMDFAFGILKTGGQSYALRMGNAQQGNLTTAYDGPKGNWTWQKESGIILGIGGDNSNSSDGTFFEGCITAGWPSDETDAAVLQNVQAAGYAR
jgi:hypothetical protein